MTRHRIRSIADQSHPVARSLHHGVVLLPEGLLSFCPETSALMRELEDLMSEVGSPPTPVELPLSRGAPTTTSPSDTATEVPNWSSASDASAFR